MPTRRGSPRLCSRSGQCCSGRGRSPSPAVSVSSWGLRISSRNALRIFLSAPPGGARLAAGLSRSARSLARADHGPSSTAWRSALRFRRRWASAPGAGAYGSRRAAASDPSGYVSEAALWARGTPRIDRGFASNLPWPNAVDTLMPLGYRIGAGGTMVPTYAARPPAVDGAGACRRRVRAVPRDAGLRRRCWCSSPSSWGGGSSAPAPPAGAALVACSPVMLFMSLTPMADLPSAAFWLGALAVAIRGTRRPPWSPRSSPASPSSSVRTSCRWRCFPG